ncbi:demethoxyubiquinone hydroxylase family protein [Niveispirillum sp. KHB5.9]|uniref:demethoxyubiquinone hydroxylase family protein n=1 Tax=Niveispirillum sp. KHB5.9 TaxID=3400269 RepID=UPI003A876918
MDRDRVLRDILRVNHAGEYGAIRIYRAQLALCRDREVMTFMCEALQDEKRHLHTFRDLMRPHAVRPCGALPLWGLGGSLLGGVTGLAGRRAVLLCTVAVERTVHTHLKDQLRWLENGPEAAAIAGIMKEEQEHADHAFSRLGIVTRMDDVWMWLIAAATEALIWMSTYGALTRMRRALGLAGNV